MRPTAWPRSRLEAQRAALSAELANLQTISSGGKAPCASCRRRIWHLECKLRTLRWKEDRWTENS